MRIAARNRVERASRRGDVAAWAFMGMVAAGAYAAVRALMSRESRDLLDMPAPLGPLAAEHRRRPALGAHEGARGHHRVAPERRTRRGASSNRSTATAWGVPTPTTHSSAPKPRPILAVERCPSGLRCCSRKAVGESLVGSNPTLSASLEPRRPGRPEEGRTTSQRRGQASRGEVPERLNGLAWKAGRGYPPLVGSNPTLSASLTPRPHPGSLLPDRPHPARRVRSRCPGAPPYSVRTPIG